MLSTLLSPLDRGATAQVGLPEPDDRGLAICPLVVLVDGTSRSSRSTSFRLRTRCAATVPSGDADGLALLEDLAAACALRSDVALLDEEAVDAWYDRGIPAGRVGLLFDVLVRHHRDELGAPPVSQPVRVDLRPTTTLSGQVRAATGPPLPGARVSVDDGSGAVTDGDGRFRLTTSGRPTALQVQVKGHRVEVVPVRGRGDGPVQVVFDDEEG